MSGTWELFDLNPNSPHKTQLEPLPPLPLSQNLKEKKTRHFENMLTLRIGCMKFLFPKLFITNFGLG
jgi:hypothetical protein